MFAQNKARVVLVLLLAFIFLLFASLKTQSVNAQVSGGNRCVCVDPVGDGCACAETAVNGSNPATVGGVSVVCATPQLASSFFNTANPVCGNNAESIPTCTGSGSGIMCWGTGFGGTLLPSSIPINSMSWVNVPGGVVTFNGQSWNTNTVFTCAASLYCCGNASNCDGGGQIAYDTCPSSQVPPPDSPAALACDTLAVGNLAGIGESRLWFSQDRLVAALSMMAQTMFNPYKLNRAYENTAFSKNATQNERDAGTSGQIDNKGSITTRIEKHQGKDDGIMVVNTSDNNSSVIVGMGAPPPLDPYYDLFKDRACYVPDTFTNPGDDLIGPKIKGEMLFTRSFSYAAKGQPQSPSGQKIGGGACTFDGGSFDINYSYQDQYSDAECQYDCCSRSCSVNKWHMSGCSRKSLILPCAAGTVSCTEGGQNYCCSSAGACNPPATVSVDCGSLGKATIPVGADANVFDKTPIIESIYDTILNGTDSLYRRFMPLPESKDYDFDEIPTESSFGASVSVANLGTVEPGTFKLEFAQGQVGSPEVYFPHLGTLHKYWLVGLQKALRPEGSTILYQGDTGSDPGTPPTPGSKCNEFSCGLILGYNTFDEGLECAARTLSANKKRGLAQLIDNYGPWCDNEAYNTSYSINPLPFAHNLFVKFYDIYTDTPRSCSQQPPSSSQILAAHNRSNPSYNRFLDNDWNVVCPNIDNDPTGIRKPGNPSYDFYRGALENCSLSSSELGWNNRNIDSVYNDICTSGRVISYGSAGQLNTAYNCNGGTQSRVYQVLKAAQGYNVNPWLLMGIWTTESVWGQIASCMP